MKDSFHDYVVHGRTSAVNPRQFGTKAAAHYRLQVPAGGLVSVRLRLFAEDETPETPFGNTFDATFASRKEEADAFYAQVIPAELGKEERRIARQAYAGMLWTKQFYHYVVKDWLDGDPNLPAPPETRRAGRNADWPHLFNRDVISVPDKWEYPWYAAWDLAFHMIPFASLDPKYAKDQLKLFLREWYMHPNGQIPAYEFNLCDVNPPVHAWACWRVYKLTASQGHPDREFLSSTFQKLLINFTWWVNRKDQRGKHLFSGGFLGLDNIGVFDRSRPLPTGGFLEQADGTAWMAFYCATMLDIATELAQTNPATEDIASKFFEHFVHIADATNTLGGTGLWDEEDGFYYDQLHVDGQTIPLRVRSMVGPDSAVGRRRDRRRRAQSAARLPKTAPLVHAIPGRPRPTDLLHGNHRRRSVARPAPAGHPVVRPAASRAGIPARRGRVPLAPRDPVPVEIPSRPSLCVPRRGRVVPRGVRAGRIAVGSVRRQFELARTRLVPVELPLDRGLAALPRLLRRASEGGMSHRLGPADESGRGRPRVGPPDWQDSFCPTSTGSGRSIAAKPDA